MTTVQIEFFLGVYFLISLIPSWSRVSHMGIASFIQLILTIVLLVVSFMHIALI